MFPAFKPSLSLQYSATVYAFYERVLIICHGFHVRFPNHLWFWASFHFLTDYVFHIIRWHEKCGLLWLCNDTWWIIEKGPPESCLMEYHFYLKAWLTNWLCIWVSGSQFSQVLKWVSFRENNWRVLLMLEFELSKDNYNPGKHISAIITLTAYYFNGWGDRWY